MQLTTAGRPVPQHHVKGSRTWAILSVSLGAGVLVWECICLIIFLHFGAIRGAGPLGELEAGWLTLFGIAGMAVGVLPAIVSIVCGIMAFRPGGAREPPAPS